MKCCGVAVQYVMMGNVPLFGLTYFPCSQPEAIIGDGEWGEDSPGGSPAAGGAAQTVQSAET